MGDYLRTGEVVAAILNTMGGGRPKEYGGGAYGPADIFPWLDASWKPGKETRIIDDDDPPAPRRGVPVLKSPDAVPTDEQALAEFAGWQQLFQMADQAKADRAKKVGGSVR